jgi:hypothetical protein
VFRPPGAGGNDADAGHWIARQRSARPSSGEVAAVLCRARRCSDLTGLGQTGLGGYVPRSRVESCSRVRGFGGDLPVECVSSGEDAPRRGDDRAAR